jgi:hypothetical protein
MKIRAASIVWSVLSILFGWTFFVWSWLDILGENDPLMVMNTLATLVVIADVFLVVTLVWISHNRRLARRGKRGLASAVRVPRFERDRVERLYVLPERLDLHSAPVLIVSVTAEQKVYKTSTTPMSAPA